MQQSPFVDYTSSNWFVDDSLGLYCTTATSGENWVLLLSPITKVMAPPQPPHVVSRFPAGCLMVDGLVTTGGSDRTTQYVVLNIRGGRPNQCEPTFGSFTQDNPNQTNGSPRIARSVIICLFDFFSL